MIGRGTRLCKGLVCVDQVDGEYVDKRRFLIFDYCGNFEYFREHKEGYENREAKTLSENIFGKKIKLAVALQESAFSDDAFQTWRKELVNGCQSQVKQLPSDLVEVRLRMEYVEKYKKQGAFDYISEGGKGEVLQHIAPIVRLDDEDELAKRFDKFMYGLMLASIEQLPSFNYARHQLCDIAALLERKSSIPQVKAKLPVLKEVQTDAFWEANDILQFERIRQELRELIKFLDSNDTPKTIITKLADPIIEQQEDNPLETAYDFLRITERK